MGLFGGGGTGYRYENTRQYLRIPASWPIKCVPQSPGESLNVAATRDVGAGGCAFYSQQCIPVGSQIHLEILVPPLNRSILANGRVVRCMAVRGGGFDLGIQFLRIDPKDQAELNDSIERLSTRGRRARHERSWWRKLS